jgi:hypothetical protein
VQRLRVLIGAQLVEGLVRGRQRPGERRRDPGEVSRVDP